MICGNHCLTVREVADEVGISTECCHQIFTEELQMCHVSAKFVLRLLTDDHPHPQLAGKMSDICCAPSTLFSGHSSIRLFPVSQT
jgi:hypothetical protein